MSGKGYFIFSLDTELGTGYFDDDARRHALFSPDGSAERRSIRRLVDLCQEFNIVGTWAVVGHLLYARCEHCQVCPLERWKDRYSSYAEAYGTGHPLWYGSDVVGMLLGGSTPQEIGFHGYSHQVFAEASMSPQDACVEIEEWLRVGSRQGLTPRSIAFPRNQVGHLEAFRQAGFICYRGEPERIGLTKNKVFGKYFKNFGQALGLSSVPVYDLDCLDDHGLVVLRPSLYLFDLNRRLDLWLNSLNLEGLRLNMIIRGIQKAAREKKMVHLWAHPCEFRTEKDFSNLRRIFQAVAREIKKGRMRSVGMTEMAGILQGS